LAREKEWSDRDKVLESYERSVSSKGKNRR